MEGPRERSRREFLKEAAAVGAITAAGIGAVEIKQLRNKRSDVSSKETREAGPDISAKDSFEKQFAKREFIDVGYGGVAEVVDISPETPSEKPPIFLDPSTLVPIDTYEYVIRDFVKAGRQVVSLNHPREGG